MDAWDDPRVRRLVVRGPSQVGGKSALMANIIGRSIHLDPTNALVLFPTIGRAENWHKTRFENMLKATAVLRGLVPSRQARDGEQSLRHRNYPGGQVFFHGANAAADLSADTVRDVFGDEIDRFDASAGKEGDPVDLAEQRQVDYGSFAKTWLSSTPTIEGHSRIDAAYEASDKRVRELPCLRCSDFVEIVWGDVRFQDPVTGEKRPELAHIRCPACKQPWTEHERQRAIKVGRWTPTAPFTGTAGFSWNAFVCPRADLVALARRFLEGLGDPEREITFANTVEVRSWRPKAEAPDWALLWNRRESWPANVLPPGACFLTAGVDIQKDRILVHLWGWGQNAECWHLGTRVLLGDTNRDEVWARLYALLDETWQAPSGAEVHLERVAIDSGAFTEEVYRRARPHRSNGRVMLVKGDHRQLVVLGTPSQVEIRRDGKKLKHGVRVWPVGSSKAKEWLYEKLPLVMKPGEPCPSGFVHFGPETTPADLKQITAEELRDGRDKYGRTRPEWHVKPGHENHGLDGWVYAYAGAIDFGLWRFVEGQWARLRARMAPDEGEPVPASAPTPAPARSRIAGLFTARSGRSDDPFVG